MADPSRTEKATPKRRQEARGKGQVGKSADIGPALSLIAALVALVVTAPATYHRLVSVVADGLARSGNPSLAGSHSLVLSAMRTVASCVAPVAMAALVAGVLANIAQIGFKFTPKALKPSFKRLSPLTGVKRVFGVQGIVATVKSVAKIAAVGGAAYLALAPALSTLAPLVGMPADALPGKVGGLLVRIAFAAASALALLAAGDFVWSRRKFEKSLRMTKDEVKQESRQAELAPEVKGAIRRKQVEFARKRMLAAIPEADVVVTNPTHYAVAFKYDPQRPAPEVLAKGADLVAQAIRRTAQEHGVPLVENPPLARALYARVEIGQLVPEELFAAVAEVLAFVYRQAGRRAV